MFVTFSLSHGDRGHFGHFWTSRALLDPLGTLRTPNVYVMFAPHDQTHQHVTFRLLFDTPCISRKSLHIFSKLEAFILSRKLIYIVRLADMCYYVLSKLEFYFSPNNIYICVQCYNEIICNIFDREQFII